MRERAATWTAAGLAVGAAAALYGSVVLGVVRQWFDDSNSSHGILLAAAAAILIVKRRRSLLALPLEPRNTGFAVLAFALVVYTLGTLMADVFVRRASIPIALLGCTLCLGGRQHARMLLAPLTLLAMAIPLPSAVVTHFTLPLQLIASQVAAGILDVFRVPVVREGNLLVLNHITLEVAEACNGLRSLVSLVSVAAVSGALLSLSLKRTMLLVAAAFPIAIVGNGVRVAATGLLTTWIGEAAVRGTLHELTGFVVFLVMCAGVITIQMLTRSRRAATPVIARV